MVAQEPEKDCCQTGSAEDECRQHLRKNRRERNIALPELKQTAEARAQKLMDDDRKKQHLSALAEND